MADAAPERYQHGLVPNGPAYVPREFCVIPTLFGKNPSVAFRPHANTADEVALCAAAEIQHRFACHVGVYLAKEHRTQKWLAGRAKMDRTRLGRLLNGTVPMRLADIGRLTAALGLEKPAWPG